MGGLSKLIRSLLTFLSIVLLSSVVINATADRDQLQQTLLEQVFVNEESICPDNMVAVPNSNSFFCIDAYEASASEACRTSNPSNQEETLFNMNDPQCAAVSESDKRPWTFVARHQAEILCARSGKRLPTNKEWYQAALGTVDSRASVERNDCNVDSQIERLTGSNDLCVSSFGSYDMVGNVWEWIDDTARNGILGGYELPKTGFVSGIDSTGLPIETTSLADLNFNEDYFSVDEEGVRGVMRGGYWGNGTDAGLYTISIVAEPTFAGAGVGFRCVL